MLGLFSAKIDHPLAREGEVKQILEMLPRQKPDAAIDEVTGWLESLSGLDNFPAALRYQRTVAFDAAAITHARRLAREYCTGPRTTRFEDHKRWQRIQSYWAHLAIAYARCLDDVDADPKRAAAFKPEIGLLYARLLHALAGRLRWTRLRYGSVEGSHWQEVGDIYLRAVDAQAAERPVSLYGQAESPTTPQREYLKVLLFHASSIDNLNLTGVGIAEYLLVHFLPHFVFTDKPTQECTYWIDAATAQPPCRLTKPPAAAPTLRFFGAAGVLQEITTLRARIQTDMKVPAAIDLNGQQPPEVVISILDHLAQCWSPSPPTRRHTRHRVGGRTSVVGGLMAVHWCVKGGGDTLSEIEDWEVDDVSQGGMSARLPLLHNDWIHVGALVGMRPTGNASWLVGTVRRFVRESETQGAAGIETLSANPRALIASDGTFETDILLLDPVRPAGAVRVVMATNNWEPGVPMYIQQEGQRWRLHPEERIEMRDEWMMGRCSAELAS